MPRRPADPASRRTSSAGARNAKGKNDKAKKDKTATDKTATDKAATDKTAKDNAEKAPSSRGAADKATSRWSSIAAVLQRPDCQGAGSIHLAAPEPFYDEAALPFKLLGGGTVFHVLPSKGFRRENLAGSADERLLVVDCPDEEGWLVPESIVHDWMARHITCPDLDDLLLAHPLYEYLTRPDEEGHSRGGRAVLAQWSPGFPNMATLYAPEFLPDDAEAPRVNRDRKAYANAVVDLLQRLEEAFRLDEVEVAVRFGGYASEPAGRPAAKPWVARVAPTSSAGRRPRPRREGRP